MILDHQNDGPFIDSKVPGRDPAAIAALVVGESRIESGLESVRMIAAYFKFVKVLECRQNNLRSKRQRRHDRPRRQRSIIRPIGYAPRHIVEEDALHSIDRQLLRAWPFTGSQSPAHFAVALKTMGISLRVFSLRIGRAATVFEIV